MPLSPLSLGVLTLAALLARPAGASQDSADASAPRPAFAPTTPVAFVPNLGQWTHRARYVARLGATTAFLEEDGIRLSFAASREPAAADPCRPHAPASARARGASVFLRFPGAALELVPEGRQAGAHEYLLGADRSRWRGDVPLYAAVRYRGLAPGVELLCYARDGHLEYDLELAPGAELSRLEFEIEGAEYLSLAADGALVLDTAAGPVREPAPVTWVVGADGARRTLAARHVLRGERRFGFEVSGWNGEEALVLDPGIVYSSFLGSTDFDYPRALAVDATGVITVAGYTSLSDYPAAPGAWDASWNGATDAFVSRLDPSRPPAQQLLYSTFLGGSQDESVEAFAVDAAGVLTLIGSTTSANFPTTPAGLDTLYDNSYDGFLVRLDPAQPAAQQLVYATFLGGTGDELLYDVAVDASGVTTVVGWSDSSNFPLTANAMDTLNEPSGDGVLLRLDPSLAPGQQLLYASFFGGRGDDTFNAMHVDESGVVTLAGSTESLDFPVTFDAWNTSHNSPITADVVVARIDPSRPPGQQLLYGTFFGGESDDIAYALSLDDSGVVSFGGWTNSRNFPYTPGAFDRLAGRGDAFVARLDPSQSAADQLVYSTSLGNGGFQFVSGLVEDAAGFLVAAGTTMSPGFPTTSGAPDRAFAGTEGFVLRLDPQRTGSRQLLYSSFLGGVDSEDVTALALDSRGFALVAGGTGSPDFEMPAPSFDDSFNGVWDVFVVRHDLLPLGVSAYGASSPGCNGPLAMGVLGWPQVGNAAFALTCTNAPPGRTGVAYLGTAARITPFSIVGLSIWVDPFSPYVRLPARGDARGFAEVPMPLPNDGTLAGLDLFAQFAWQGPSAPPCPPLGYSASNALRITIQP